MSDPRRVVSGLMAAFIQGRFGCFDAAAATISARWGGGASKGTLSKKAAGLLDWTVADVIALEDAAGDYPVTRMLAKRMDGAGSRSDGAAVLPILHHAGCISREAGEAVRAVLDAAQSGAAGDVDAALKELLEAEAALAACRERLQPRSGLHLSGRVA